MMYDLSDVFYFFILVAGLFYWSKTMAIKEIAHKAAKRACGDANVLFLDDSVVAHKTRLRRNDYGRIKIYREYHFEFTTDGSQRYHGEIHLLGKHVKHVELDAYRIL